MRTLGDINADMLTGPSVDRIFGPVIAAGVSRYTRDHLYSRLEVAFYRAELDDYSVAGCERIIAKLKERCASMRALGLRAHWSYDTNRHLGLLIALEAEKQNLARARTCDGVPLITTGEAA